MIIAQSLVQAKLANLRIFREQVPDDPMLQLPTPETLGIQKYLSQYNDCKDVSIIPINGSN